MTLRLKTDVTPVRKKNSLTEIRADGESFSIYMIVNGKYPFKMPRLFGDKKARDRVRKEIQEAIESGEVKIVEE